MHNNTDNREHNRLIRSGVIMRVKQERGREGDREEGERDKRERETT